MKKSITYFGHKIIDGVWKFVRRWAGSETFEVIPEEELKRESEERIARYEAVKAALLARKPNATQQEIYAAIIAEERHLAASDPTEEEVGDVEFEMARKIALLNRPGGDLKRAATLHEDPDYLKARDAGDTEAMSKAAAAFARRR